MRAIEPGVYLGDVGGGVAATFGGDFAKGALFLRRAKATPGRRLDRLRLPGGLELKPVEPGLEFKLAGEGLALVGAGAQALHLLAVLVGLVAVRIDAGGRRPRLGRRGGGEGEQGQGGNDQPGHG